MADSWSLFRDMGDKSWGVKSGIINDDFKTLRKLETGKVGDIVIIVRAVVRSRTRVVAS